MEDQLGRLMSIQISNITLLTSVKAGQMAAAARQLLRNLIPSLQGDKTQAKNNTFVVYLDRISHNFKSWSVTKKQEAFSGSISVEVH